ncbi:MAG TPA: flagellar export chaperone FlgN [Rhodothermales bacterium]|nr:flagellar export chaperone FlgN [Rhodothermales bacterium]
MNPTAITGTAGPASQAATLLATLRNEHAALKRLSAHFDAQLAALQDRNPERLDAATQQVAEEMNTVIRLRQARERQMRLLARVMELDDGGTLTLIAERLQDDTETYDVGAGLAEIREHVLARAKETHRKGQVLAFAIQYASQIGLEMMQTIQGVQVPVSALVYNAAGGTSHATPRTSYLNRVG